MSESSLVENTRLAGLVKTINNIDLETISTILPKLFQRLCESHSSALQGLFLPNERTKIKQLLSLDDEALDGIISSFRYIIQQAIFHLMKPAYFTVYLKELGFNEELSTLITELWSTNAKSLISIQKKELCSSDTVTSVESSLHCVLSSHRNGHTKIPSALVHLNMTDDSSRPTTMSIEFNHEELVKFYQTLESIQNALDSMI